MDRGFTEIRSDMDRGFQRVDLDMRGLRSEMKSDVEALRTTWSDGRLDDFSRWTKSDVARIEREIRALRAELGDVRDRLLCGRGNSLRAKGPCEADR
jgi:hypothetical protein